MGLLIVQKFKKETLIGSELKDLFRCNS